MTRRILAFLALLLAAPALAQQNDAITPLELVAPGQQPDLGDCPTFDGNRFLWQSSCGGGGGSGDCHKHHCSDELCFEPRTCDPTMSFSTGIGVNGDAQCAPGVPCHKHHCSDALCFQPRTCDPETEVSVGIGKNGDAFCIPSSGGADCASAPDLLCRDGRPDGTNDATISSDADGTITGSSASGGALILDSDHDADPILKGINLQRNVLGLTRLLVGPKGSDPTSALAPGGILQFLITAGEPSEGAYFSAFAANDGNNPPVLFLIRGRGTVFAPTQTMDNDRLGQIDAVGYDSDDMLNVGSSSSGIIAFRQAGAASPGCVPGAIELSTTRTDCMFATYLHLNGHGNTILNHGLMERSTEAVLDAYADDVEPKFVLLPSFSNTGEAFLGDLVDGALFYNTDEPAGHPYRGIIGGAFVSFITTEGADTVVLPGPLVFQGAIPTCGTGCASLSANSNDRIMDVTVSGGVVTSVTANFSTTLVTTPNCTASTDSATIGGAAVTAVSTTSVTFGTPVSIGGGHIFAHCFES